jgi:hypothetical protein
MLQVVEYILVLKCQDMQENVYERIGMATISVQYTRADDDPLKARQFEPEEENPLWMDMDSKSPFNGEVDTQAVTIV